MLFADLTYEELAEPSPRVDAVFTPLGCTEQQGPHLPVDFDTRMVAKLCNDIAVRLEEQSVAALVMPVLPFGPTPEHVGLGHGYVNLRQSTHKAVVEDVLKSLSAQGFGRMMLWRGCGQHELGEAVKRLHCSHDNVQAHHPLIDYGAISCDVPGDVPGGHADSFATSVCLLMDEASVRVDRISRPGTGPWNGITR